MKLPNGETIADPRPQGFSVRQLLERDGYVQIPSRSEFLSVMEELKGDSRYVVTGTYRPDVGQYYYAADAERYPEAASAGFLDAVGNVLADSFMRNERAE